MAESATNPSDEPPVLDQDAIVRAAMHVVDHEGLDALTMRRLGAELGVEAMSIYHHVPNKAALLDMLVDRVLAPARLGAASDSIVEMFDHLCRQLHRSMTERPNMVPLVAPVAPGVLSDSPVATAAVVELTDRGFDVEAARWVVDAFIGATIGHVMVRADPGADANDADAAFETGLRFMLVGLREELG